MKRWLYKALPYLFIVIISTLGFALLEGVVSIILMNLIDAAVAGDGGLLKQEGYRLFTFTLFLVPIGLVYSFTKGLFKRKAIVLAKVNYVEGIFKKNINEFQRDNDSKYLSTLTNDVNAIETNYIDGVLEVTINVIYFMVSVLVIAYVSPVALGVGIGIIGISTIISIVLSKPLEKHHVQRSDLYEGYTSYIKEVLSAFHIIKSNDLKEKVDQDFFNKSNDIQQKGYLIDKIYSYISALQNLNMTLAFYILTAVAAFMAIKGTITLGGVILIINNMEKIMRPLMGLGEWMPKIFSTKQLFEKIDETLENKQNYEEAITLTEFKDFIQFNNVSFKYEDGDEVLRDINLSFKKGEKYLIIGPSGGGKSTLLKLLRKYFSPQGGEILIGNDPLMDITKSSYFAHIANIEQQVFLFEDTLRNNITLYNDYTEEEINTAIERAGLRGFLDMQLDGLETMIYDNGKNISGGEKSRVAIARGLLRRADIIFIDEAFASLDAKTAQEIEKTILDLEGVTVINVSHVIFDETMKIYNKVLMVKNKSVYAI